MITPDECRIFRDALRWSVCELAKNANVTPETVKKFELGEETDINTAKALKNALRASGGIRFND